MIRLLNEVSSLTLDFFSVLIPYVNNLIYFNITRRLILCGGQWSCSELPRKYDPMQKPVPLEVTAPSIFQQPTQQVTANLLAVRCYRTHMSANMWPAPRRYIYPRINNRLWD